MWLDNTNIDLYLAGTAVSLFLARLNGFEVVKIGRTWEITRQVTGDGCYW